MRRRTLQRSALSAALTGLLLTFAHASQADEPEWYEGLPDTTFGNWSNAAQGGMSYAKRAKQWFRAPMGMTVAEVYVGMEETSDPQLSIQWVRAEGYFVSPSGAPANYGYLEPMTVRSVGFGMMPVEATVQISQRWVDGYPAPVKVLLKTEFLRTPLPGGGLPRLDQSSPSIVVTDSFDVRILSVRVDGVDVGLTGDCRTREPAPVTMRSPAYTIPNIGPGRSFESANEWFRVTDPSQYFNPIKGGELTGSLTIPPFIGCTTKGGDDLSDLMTLSASGPDNPISARVGWPCAFVKDGAPAPAPPGASSPKLGTQAGGVHGSNQDPGCPGAKPFEYPTRADG